MYDFMKKFGWVLTLWVCLFFREVAYCLNELRACFEFILLRPVVDGKNKCAIGADLLNNMEGRV